MGPLAQVGLALATSIGAWINLALVVWFGIRAGHIQIDARLRESAIKLAAAGGVLALVLWLCAAPVARFVKGWRGIDDIAALALLAAIGGTVYGGIVLALFGRRWLATFRSRSG